MADEYVFGGVIPFGFAMMILGAITMSACWGLAIAVAGRGKSRTWLRNPIRGEAKFTEALPPYRENWRRGLVFMPWWTRLLLPVLLMLPGGLTSFLFELDWRMSLWGALLWSACIALPFGLMLVVLRHLPAASEADV